jgi:hypothetical protein
MINPFKWFRRELLLKAKLPDKDPNDFRLTNNSTNWETEDYCPQCKATIGHREYMSDVCNTCGTVFDRYGIIGRRRSYRQIVQNGRWVIQYKYNKNKIEIRKNRY